MQGVLLDQGCKGIVVPRVQSDFMTKVSRGTVGPRVQGDFWTKGARGLGLLQLLNKGAKGLLDQGCKGELLNKGAKGLLDQGCKWNCWTKGVKGTVGSLDQFRHYKGLNSSSINHILHEF